MIAALLVFGLCFLSPVNEEGLWIIEAGVFFLCVPIGMAAFHEIIRG